MNDLVHPALVYSSDEDFLATNIPFLREGLGAGERTLAVTSRRNIGLLTDALGGDAAPVDFHEARDWLTTPWRALLAYRRYVNRHAGNDMRVRVIGEPFAPERTSAAAIEWTRYESMINIAFADLPLTILCPYDTRTLPAAVVDHALRTHPVVMDEAGIAPSPDFVDTRAFSAELDRIGLEEAPSRVAELPLNGSLDDVRRFVVEEARRAGVASDVLPDLTLAAHEIVTNARTHGRGRGVVRTWTAEQEFVCEVADTGPGMEDPLVGHVEPGEARTGGRGLWLARHLCDLVQVRSGPAGTVVRLHVALA